LTAKNGLKLAIKVGGAEAKSDIKSSVELCCDSIVGPMIESQYAFDKYAKSCSNLDLSKGVNIETFTAVENIDMILSSQYLTDIDYFVIGRVDLIGSYGKSRDDIDSDKVCAVIEETFRKIKKKKKKTYLGGSISTKSKEFIKGLYEKNLLDYIETRYVIMELSTEFFETFDDAIHMSHKFELEWMKYLSTKYTDVVEPLNNRIQMAQKRINPTFTIDTTTLWYDTNDIRLSEIEVCGYRVTFTNSSVHMFINRDTDFVIADARFESMLYQYHNVVYIHAHEYNKSMSTAMDIISYIKPHTRRIVVIGGGLIQDVGSFVSSIYNRGIPWVYFPTTLLSMADSCIGSKTSLNTTTKNKIGTFYSPDAVYINTSFLQTLDTQQLKSGMGEILKLLTIGNALHLYKKLDVEQLIKLSLIIKKSVIEVDLHDKGIRKGLNYGHTIGHAIEVLSEYRIPHGLAVVHGMLLMNKICGYSDALFEKYAIELVGSRVPEGVDFTKIKKILDQDKKVNGDTITCIVPKNSKHFCFVTSSSLIIQNQLLSLAHL
jgi:3-dehydroquinate synthase